MVKTSSIGIKNGAVSSRTGTGTLVSRVWSSEARGLEGTVKGVAASSGHARVSVFADDDDDDDEEAEELMGRTDGSRARA